MVEKVMAGAPNHYFQKQQTDNNVLLVHKHPLGDGTPRRKTPRNKMKRGKVQGNGKFGNENGG